MFAKYSKLIQLLIIMFAVILVFSLIIPNKFLTLLNFQSMASIIPEFGILAIAMTIAIITGGIDLSIVSIANLCGVIMAIILKRTANLEAINNVNPEIIIIVAILAGLIIAVLCGFFNGFLISFFGVPPILGTLGTQGLFLGIAIILTKGSGISGFSEKFLLIGGGKISFIPIPFIIFIVVAVISTLFLSKTQLGVSMYMVGSNSIASRFSGIENNRVILKTYMITGFLSGISAIIMISRVNSMRPGYGSGYLLQTILIAALGGIDFAGGKGKVIGIFMAIVILQTLQSGFNILALSPFFRNFIWGIMLIFVMAINHFMAVYKRGMVRTKI